MYCGAALTVDCYRGVIGDSITGIRKAELTERDNVSVGRNKEGINC